MGAKGQKQTFVPRYSRRKVVTKVFDLGDLQGVERADADPRLSMRAKYLFRLIVKHKGDLSTKDVQNVSNASPREVLITFKELVDAEYIRRERSTNAGGQICYPIDILV